MSDLSADSDIMLSHFVSVNWWTAGHYWRRRVLQVQLFLLLIWVTLKILKLQNYFYILKYLFFWSFGGHVGWCYIRATFFSAPIETHTASFSVRQTASTLVCVIVVVCTSLCVGWVRVQFACFWPALSGESLLWSPFFSTSLSISAPPPAPKAPRPYNLLY